jgi:hypothetical protein
MEAESRGVLYAVTGESNLAEVLFSAASLKRCMPELPITLVTDVSGATGPFETVIHVPTDAYDRAYTIRAVQRLPYERTLYLDSDTYVCGRLDSIFETLERHDMAGVVVPGLPKYTTGVAPESFPSVNGGVLAFRRSDRTTRFLALWLATYEEHNAKERRGSVAPGQQGKKFLPNQPSLRETLFASDIRFGVLRQSYNCRLDHLNIVDGEVKILHGGHADLARIAREVNEYQGKRSFFVQHGKCVLHPTRFERRLSKLHLRARQILGLYHRGS